MSGKCGQLLSWTHYRVVVQELNADARKWYVHETLSQNWSVRTLQHNVSSQYYYRILSSQQKELVEREMPETRCSTMCPQSIAPIWCKECSNYQRAKFV